MTIYFALGQSRASTWAARTLDDHDRTTKKHWANLGVMEHEDVV
jgi:hypothetical protein